MDGQKEILAQVQEKGLQIGEKYIVKPTRRNAIVWIDIQQKNKHWTTVFDKNVSIHETYQDSVQSSENNKHKHLFSISPWRFMFILIKSLFTFETLHCLSKIKQFCLNIDDPLYKDWIILPFKTEDFLTQDKKRVVLQVSEKEADYLLEFLIRRRPLIKIKESSNYDFEGAILISPPTGELLLRQKKRKFLYRYNVMKQYTTNISYKVKKYLQECSVTSFN